MRNLMIAAGLAALTACGYSLEKAGEDIAQASCEWTVECYPEVYADVDACLADAEDPPSEDDCPDYDSAKAKECRDGIEAMDCPAEGEFPEFPAACAEICGEMDTTR